tara:strand:+ start:1081 stop:1977 length:897 start_codon:yes stop_codon:yes gene_type:complete
MTLSEITTEVRNITGVDSTTVVSDAIIHDLINEAQFQLCDEANLLQGYATRNSVADTSEYPLKDSNSDEVTDWTIYQTNLSGGSTSTTSLETMTRIFRVDYDGSITQRIGINEISDIGDDASLSNITTSYAYYMHDDKLGIFPTPTEVKEIKVYYYRLPHLMFSDATCDITNSNADVTMDSTSLVREGMNVSGAEIGSPDKIVETVANTTTFRMSANATTTTGGSVSDTTLIFGKPEIDERYQRILIYYPCWRVSERLRDLNLISYFKNEWLEQKQRVIMERQSRDGSPILTVPYNDF